MVFDEIVIESRVVTGKPFIPFPEEVLYYLRRVSLIPSELSTGFQTNLAKMRLIFEK